jgi:hypothetical protein
MDSKANFKGKTFVMGTAYRRFGLSSARNNWTVAWHYLNIKVLNRYRYVKVGLYCSKIYSLPVF